MTTANAPAAHRQRVTRLTLPPPPAPPLPAALDHRWPDQWTRRSYLELAADDIAPRTARAHARTMLHEWHLPAISDDATLIVSELVTNAATATQAAGSPAPVRLWLLGRPRAGALLLIWDATSPAPAPAAATLDAERGRGLTLVDALSQQWGCYRPAGPPGGKVTWAACMTSAQAAASGAFPDFARPRMLNPPANANPSQAPGESNDRNLA